jgi:predicted MFS family arabinose efflux permease
VGEVSAALVAASVPLAWWMQWLSMEWLYVVGFVLGTVHTVAGSAAQIVLMQVVPRERLVEAHAKNALASSGAEVVGPGIAGALIKVFGAPLALLVNAVLLLGSAMILRGIHVHERRDPQPDAHFWRDLATGVRFVRSNSLLMTLALLMAVWQMCHYAAVTVQILFATRTLGLSEHAVGLCYMGMGVGTITGSVLGRRVSHRIGPGPCLVVGYAITGLGWLLLALAPANAWGVAAFALMLMLFTTGAVFIFINFLARADPAGRRPRRAAGRLVGRTRGPAFGPGLFRGGFAAAGAGGLAHTADPRAAQPARA